MTGTPELSCPECGGHTIIEWSNVPTAHVIESVEIVNGHVEAASTTFGLGEPYYDNSEVAHEWTCKDCDHEEHDLNLFLAKTATKASN